MRNLTITRTKSFVACLGKMKVYIEDPMGGDTVISGVNCRKLGDLKNGETVTFPIGEEAARVYVIADQMSKNYSNDYYPLEAGTEDVVLTGKNHFNPGAGNPFRFDGVTDETVLANRKKGGRMGIVILILAAIFGAIMGRSCARVVQPQDFTVDNMTITLNSEFRTADYEGFTKCYESYNMGVSVLKESFSQYPILEDYTLEEYEGLTAEQRKAFRDHLGSAGYAAWLEWAEEEAEPVEIPWSKPSAKQPKEYTWAEYQALTEKQKKAFMEHLGPQGLEAWLAKVQDKKEENPWEVSGAKQPKDYTWA